MFSGLRPTGDDGIIPAVQVHGEARGVGEALVQPHVLLILLSLLLGPVGTPAPRAAAPHQSRLVVLRAAGARESTIGAPQAGGRALLTPLVDTEKTRTGTRYYMILHCIRFCCV